MPIEIDPPISCQPQGMARLEFRTFDEVRSWANREHESWQDWETVPPGQTLSRILTTWKDTIRNASRDLIQICDESQSADPARVANLRDRLAVALQEYQDRKKIAGDSPDGIRLIAKWKNGQVIEAIIDAQVAVLGQPIDLPIWLGRNHEISLPIVPAISAIASATVLKKIEDETGRSFAESHKRIFADFQSRLDQRLLGNL